MRYKVEFEFEVAENEYDLPPIDWRWSDLIDISDENTQMDWDSLKIYKTMWVLA